MSKRRHETPPPGHPLPSTFTPGGWQWDPEAGDYVPAQASPELAGPPLLNPAPDSPEATL
jgi:hypothetical protein